MGTFVKGSPKSAAVANTKGQNAADSSKMPVVATAAKLKPPVAPAKKKAAMPTMQYGGDKKLGNHF